MLQYWFEFKDVQNDKTPCTKKTIIWNNPQDIKIDNKMIFFRTWFDKGVYTLHLLDPNLDFLTYEEFKLRYQLRTNFLTYYGLINAIPQEYNMAQNGRTSLIFIPH